MYTVCSSRSSELNCGSVLGRYTLNPLRKVTQSLRATLTHPGCGRVVTIFKFISSGGGECTLCTSFHRVYLSSVFLQCFNFLCLSRSGNFGEFS